MSTYDIQINGVTIHVKVVDRAASVTRELSHLRSLIGAKTAVGFMVKSNQKYTPDFFYVGPVEDHPDHRLDEMLQLCVGTLCLVIRLTRLDSFPPSLKEFLNDQDVNFVGHWMERGLSFLKCCHGIDRKGGNIEVSELASRFFRKPGLWGSPLQAIATEVGLSNEEFSKSSIKDWGAEVFSVEQMKYAVQDVYACYHIGNKFIDMLE